MSINSHKAKQSYNYLKTEQRKCDTQQDEIDEIFGRCTAY